MDTTNAVHVVLGAGQVGGALAQLLRAQGKMVRVVRRSGAASEQVRVGDLAELAFAQEAARGAAVLYHCVNPAYHLWHAQLPSLTAGVLHAAKTSGAPLVVLDNLYMYDVTRGPMTEATAVAPVSKKGELRARLAAQLLEAHRAGDARVAIGRAADFFGPHVTQSAVFGERFFQRAFAGKPAELSGDGALLHSYSYAPDVAAGLLALGAAPHALGQVWHLPVAPAESTQRMVERFAQALGRPLTLSHLPVLVLRALGLFSPLIREVPEMTYQWRSDFVLDDSKFRGAFPQVQATPLEVSVPATVAWARQQYGQARAA